MTRNAHSAITFTIAVAAAMVSGSAFAEGPIIDDTRFVGTLSRGEVSTQLKAPYSGGNPWSSQYNMFQRKSALTREQVASQYKMSREEANLLTAEDSGSAYFMKAGVLPPQNGTATMGAPAR